MRHEGKLALPGPKRFQEVLSQGPEDSLSPLALRGPLGRGSGQRGGSPEAASVLLASWGWASCEELPGAGGGQRGHRGGFQFHSVQEGLLEGSCGDLFLVRHGLQLSADKAPRR